MSQPTLHASVTLDRLTFTWPDGSHALDGLSGAFGSGRTGLVGRNGAGKSTLLRLMAGELEPTSGVVTASGDVAYLPQQLTLDVDRRVAELLGVSEALDAVRAISTGDVDPAHFDAVGDDWDIEARAQASLAEAGLAPDFLDRRVGELSGGEAVLVAIAGIRLRRAPITLLDEPTNNLDRDARAKLGAMVQAWKGTLIVVSHDRYFLERVTDQQYGILGGHLRHLPGGVDEYLRLRASHADTTGAAAAKSGTKDAPAVSGADLRATQKEISAIERKLVKLDDQIKDAQRRQAEHDQGDYEGLRGLTDGLRELEAEVTTLEERWLELSEQIG